MEVPEGFEYTRPVPEDWAADLARLAPKSDRVTWLHLVWMPGDPWQPVQRWAIYEMTPITIWWDHINAQRKRGHKLTEIFQWGLLQEFEGPDPRTQGRYDGVLKQFLSDAVITKQEWDLFQQHQAIPMLYWIIQGTTGGHKRRFSDVEKKYLELAGLPTDPPAPGDLPYAPYDRRVLDQLARRDRLQQGKEKLSGNTDARSTQMQAFRAELVKWLEDQMRDVLESEKISLDNLPTNDGDPVKAKERMEREEENFIVTGSTTEAA